MRYFVAMWLPQQTDILISKNQVLQMLYHMQLLFIV